jgi:hypothetical protein
VLYRRCASGDYQVGFSFCVAFKNVMLALTTSASPSVVLMGIVVAALGNGRIVVASAAPPVESSTLNCEVWSMPCTPDATILTDGKMTERSSTLYSPSAHWTSGDIGKPIDVQYAGNMLAAGTYGFPAATGDIVTTIQGVTNSHQVVLSANAVTSTSGQILSLLVASGGTGYALHDTGTIGSCGATYEVLSEIRGVVSIATTENAGTGCVVTNSTPTKATSGSGKGLTLNIESVSTGARVIYGTDNGPAIDSALANTLGRATLYIPTGSYVDTHQHKLNGLTTVTRITGDGMNHSLIYQVGQMLRSDDHITPSTYLFNVTASGYAIDHLGLSGTDWNTVQRANGGGGGWGLYLTNPSIMSGTFTNDAFNYFWGNGMGAAGGESGIHITDNYGTGDAADCFNPNVNHSVISNNHMIHCGTGGIETAGVYNTVTGNQGYGSYVCLVLGGGKLSGHNSVTGNSCNNNYIGFSLSVGEQDDTFTGNTASQNDYIGMDVVQSGVAINNDETCSQGSASYTLTCADGPFLSPYVTNDILIEGTGPGGANEYCAIAAWVSTTQVRVSCIASTAISSGTAIIATTLFHFTQRNLIANNRFYSNGCTNYALCNTRRIPGGQGQGVYIAAGNNTFENNKLGDSNVAGFSQAYGVYAKNVDSIQVIDNVPTGDSGFDYYFNGTTNVLFSDARNPSQYRISNTSATFITKPTGPSVVRHE